jgi:hypothetical protein
MSYLLILGTVLLGLLSLHKDWHNYKPWVRRAVAAVLLVVGAFSLIKNYRDNQQAQIARTKAANDINTLKTELAELHGQAKAANDAQTQNTKVFLETLNRLSDKVRDLQTQVKTEDLRKQLASVQSDLQKTQKALAPEPKAALALSFVPVIDPPGGRPSPVTYKAFPLLPDGTVHVEYTIVNFTEVPALDLEITLIVCAQCKFAKEPQDYSHLPGQTDTERNVMYQRLFPMVAFRTCTVDIVPPKDVDDIQIGMKYRCRTCIVQHGQSSAIVHLLR